MGGTIKNKSFGDTNPPPKLEFEKCCSRRGANPMCTNFFFVCKQLVLHPTGYFCSNCKWYENQIMSGGGKD